MIAHIGTKFETYGRVLLEKFTSTAGVTALGEVVALTLCDPVMEHFIPLIAI